MKKVISKSGILYAASTLLMFVLILTLRSFTSEAATRYVVVSGNKLTTSCSGSGYTYDLSTNTLTLNNYNGGQIIYEGSSQLNIILNNSNTITCDSSTSYESYGISTYGSLNISGTSGSSLTIGKSSATNDQYIGILSLEDITISNTKLNINLYYGATSCNDMFGAGIVALNNLKLNGISGTINADIAGCATSITVTNSSCNKYIASYSFTQDGNESINVFSDTSTVSGLEDLTYTFTQSGVAKTVTFGIAAGTTVESGTDITKIVNYEFTKGSLKYKITASNTVAVTGAKSTSTKSITIPATVTNGGTKYKVTSIAESAFKNYKKLKKVVIGTNIKTIGKNAFYGDKKLTTATIKSKKITSIGQKAFNKISTKATINCPSSKLKKYKKLLKKSGISSKITIK